jgi:hypothetical protein
VDLNGHEAGNSGYSQRKPTAHWDSSTRKVTRTPGFVTYLYSLEKFAGALSCPKCRSAPLPPDLRSEKFLLLSDQGYTGLSLVTGAPIPKRLKMMRKRGIWV